MTIHENELEYSFFRSSGPGGQKKNVTESAVRLRHRPTGITVVSTESRSQHANKERARKELERRLAALRRKRKRRVPTGPSKAARVRRIESKKRRSCLKKLRKPPRHEE